MRVYTRDARRAIHGPVVECQMCKTAIEYRIVSSRLSNVRANRDFPPRPPTYVRIPSQSDLRRLVDWRTASDRTTGESPNARDQRRDFIAYTWHFTLYTTRRAPATRHPGHRTRRLATRHSHTPRAGHATRPAAAPTTRNVRYSTRHKPRAPQAKRRIRHDLLHRVRRPSHEPQTQQREMQERDGTLAVHGRAKYKAQGTRRVANRAERLPPRGWLPPDFISHAIQLCASNGGRPTSCPWPPSWP